MRYYFFLIAINRQDFGFLDLLFLVIKLINFECSYFEVIFFVNYYTTFKILFKINYYDKLNLVD